MLLVAIELAPFLDPNHAPFDNGCFQEEAAIGCVCSKVGFVLHS